MKSRFSSCLAALLVAALTALSTGSAFAQSDAAKSTDPNAGQRPMRGWFFFEDPPKPKKPEPAEEPPQVVQLPTTPPPPPKEDKCRKKDSWSAECGFVDPGQDFGFQAKQRDALLERMALTNNDPKAVEAFQYYMRWALERTSQVTNLWWYNMVQNPDLDPSVTAPVSTFGLRLMTGVRDGKRKEIFELLRQEGAFFVYFSRTDCSFCTQMGETFQRVSERSGVPLRNASLDSSCMPGFQQGCMTAPATLQAAQALQVTTVPTLFLYVPGNTWLRIATGVVDVESILTRTEQFFAAYRNALLKGVENGQNGRASVDFGFDEATGTAQGTAKTADKARLPTEDELGKLLGK